MVEYIAFHSDNETLGQGFLAAIEMLSMVDFDPFLTQFGVEDIVADAWYPQQLELDVLHTIYEACGKVALIQIGRRIPDVVEYGVEVKTIEDAIGLLDVGYKYNHRGPDVGSFKHDWLEKRTIRMTSRTPYPNDLDFGILWRLIEKFRPDDSENFSVEYDNDGNDDPDICIYLLKW